MWASQAEYMENFRATTVGCECPEEGNMWDCVDCPIHGEEAAEECRLQHEAEVWAENGWLRAAENSMEYCPDWAM